MDKTNPGVTETVKKIKKGEVFYKATSRETIYKVTSGEVIYKVTWNENPRNFSRGETDISGAANFGNSIWIGFSVYHNKPNKQLKKLSQRRKLQCHITQKIVRMYCYGASSHQT